MKHQVFSAYHAESQEALEYFHQTLKTMWHTYCFRTGTEWDEGVFSCFLQSGKLMHVLKLKVLCGRIRVFVDCVFPVETFMQRPVCPGRRKILSFCFMWVSRPFGSWGYIRQTRINMLKDVVSMFKGNVHWSGIMLWPDRWSTDTWQNAFRSRKNGQDG